MEEWPEIPFPAWEKTCDTLHMWTQIVGKTRLELTPLENHWWNVALYVTPRGLTTSPIPSGHATFSVDFDLIAHQLVIRTSEGAERAIPLFARSVADFYAAYMTALRSLGIEVSIYRTPVEFDDVTPFDQDQRHAAYDVKYVERFRQVLTNIDQAFKTYRSRFLGKSSPVHFFWGSFDLAVTRFSGDLCPLPDDVDPVTREAYSHAVISCGFWPGDRRYPEPAFYSYTKPAPDGLDKQAAGPAGAYWDTQLGEFLLKYEDVRKSASPTDAILEFCQSTYDAGANLAGWNRDALERKV